jgi:hypothetical protein
MKFKRAIAGLFALCAGALTQPAQAANGPPVPSLAAQDCAVTQAVPYQTLMNNAPSLILFADTDHRYETIWQQMASEANVDAMACSGVRNIVLEIPTEMQPTLDALADGTIDRDAFVEDVTTKIEPQNGHGRIRLKRRQI